MERQPPPRTVLQKEADAIDCDLYRLITRVHRGNMRKIYVASSWRNPLQSSVCALLRMAGHEVYDYKHPKGPGSDGFHWSEVDPNYKAWNAERFIANIRASRTAEEGFYTDMRALDWCDTCVLVLPCGRSAHLEAGYACGQKKRVLVLLNDVGFEPELMYLMSNELYTDITAVMEALQS